MARVSILRRLKGGDRRSIGRANDVVAEVLADPSRFGELFDGLYADDVVVRARAADAVEKISAVRPDLLRPYKSRLIGALARSAQQEVRWHVAQMLPRVLWSPRQRRIVYAILTGYLRDSSSLVKTFAMQALADLARQTPSLRAPVTRTLQELTRRGTPAMRARGRQLLAGLASIGKPINR